MVSADAPQVGCPDDEKKRFWQDLFDVRAALSRAFYTVVGHLNWHVGPRDGYKRVHGSHSIGERNTKGELIQD